MIHRLRDVGGEKALILTGEMTEHLRLIGEAEVTFEEGRIVLTTPMPRPGKNRETFIEAVDSTLVQYTDTLKRLGATHKLHSESPDVFTILRSSVYS